MRPLINASLTNQEYEENISVTLKRLRHSDLNNLIFSHLNINSIRNRVGDLGKIVDGNINPIQDGLFRGCSRMGGLFGPSPLKSATNILQ